MSLAPPIHVFRFEVTFLEEAPPGSSSSAGGQPELCKGAFSECSGLEATMEPKIIREGGNNYGASQRAGRVTFGTVILRRGVTSNTDLWRWWELVTKGAYAYRLTATVTLRGPNESAPPTWQWRLKYCMPVKFKAPDLNATSDEIAIEELHLAHEGLELVRASAGSAA